MQKHIVGKETFSKDKRHGDKVSMNVFLLVRNMYKYQKSMTTLNTLIYVRYN